MKLATALLCFLLASCGSLMPPLSPLIVAAREGDTARIGALIASGADVNERGGVNNWTPLMHAIHKNQAGSVRALLDAHASADSEALTMAAGYGYANIVRLLLERSVAPSTDALDAAVSGSTDIDRFTLGHCQVETVKALLEKSPGLRLKANSLARRAACKEVAAMLER
jgi:ankyrin repeat protein